MTRARSIAALVAAALCLVTADASAEEVHTTDYGYARFAATTQSDGGLWVGKFEVRNLGTAAFQCWAQPSPGCTVDTTNQGRIQNATVTLANLGDDRMKLTVVVPQPKSKLVFVFETPMKKR